MRINRFKVASDWHGFGIPGHCSARTQFPPGVHGLRHAQPLAEEDEARRSSMDPNVVSKGQPSPDNRAGEGCRDYCNRVRPVSRARELPRAAAPSRSPRDRT